MNKAMQAITRALMSKIKLILSKAIVEVINDSTEVQLVTVSALQNEKFENIERLQEYGLSSVPPESANAILGSLGGDRSHTVILKMGVPSQRPKDKAEGDVTLWDIHGNMIELTADGISITAPEVNINNGTKGAARLDDKVTCIIPIGTVIVDVTGGSGAPAVGVSNSTEITLEGTIDEASGTVIIGN